MKQPHQRAFNRGDQLPTAADYIAGGAAPLLIMTMVGSLVWFAQDLVYQGEHAVRLRWTLFWFVVGMVGISRIAIERTRVYAGLFALALGGAVALLINQFFVMPLAGWLLLGLIWWCTNKLVWDCTLIDDQEDASGEGLLEIAGIDETSSSDEREDVAVKHIEAGKRSGQRKTAWWQRLFVNQSSRPGRPHAPGLWIIIFSIAALPLFGFGQVLLVRAQRTSPGLILTTVYLTSAIGLLLLTSFLGLRRYLRQRRLKMPARIAATWLGFGCCIIVGVLLFCFFLPRPVAIASSPAAGSALAGRKENEIVVKNDPNATDESEKATSGGERESAANKQAEGGAAAPQESKPAQNNSNRGMQDRGKTGGGGRARPEIALPSMPGWLHWIVWAALACVLVYVAVRNWRQVIAALRELIESLRGLFRHEQGRRRRSRTAKQSEVESGPKLRFADLPNPFLAAQPADPATTVLRTFAALEVWAAERGVPRAPDTTPTEFAQHLMSLHPELSGGIRRLARIYAGLVYADRDPQADELPALAELWSGLEARQAGEFYG